MVRVSDDGGVAVAVAEPGAEDADLREQALHHGWGEPLSWVRRGFHQVGGAAVGPADSPTCLLVLGDPHDVAIMVLELVKDGWQLLSDRPTPVGWDGERLVAQPREAPLLVAERRAAKAGVDGDRIRTDSDALAVAVPRATEPRQVAAAVQVRTRRPDNETLQVLTGHERFEAATSLYIGGALDPTAAVAEDSPGSEDAAVAPNLLSEHLRISRLPWVRLHMSSKTPASDAAELVKWWDSVPYDLGSKT